MSECSMTPTERCRLDPFDRYGVHCPRVYDYACFDTNDTAPAACVEEGHDCSKSPPSCCLLSLSSSSLSSHPPPCCCSPAKRRHHRRKKCQGLACFLRTLSFSRPRPHWCDGRSWGGKIWGVTRTPGDYNKANWGMYFDPKLSKEQVQAICWSRSPPKLAKSKLDKSAKHRRHHYDHYDHHGPIAPEVMNPSLQVPSGGPAGGMGPYPPTGGGPKSKTKTSPKGSDKSKKSEWLSPLLPRPPPPLPPPWPLNIVKKRSSPTGTTVGASKPAVDSARTAATAANTAANKAGNDAMAQMPVPSPTQQSASKRPSESGTRSGGGGKRGGSRRSASAQSTHRMHSAHSAHNTHSTHSTHSRGKGSEPASKRLPSPPPLDQNADSPRMSGAIPTSAREAAQKPSPSPSLSLPPSPSSLPSPSPTLGPGPPSLSASDDLDLDLQDGLYESYRPRLDDFGRLRSRSWERTSSLVDAEQQRRQQQTEVAGASGASQAAEAEAEARSRVSSRHSGKDTYAAHINHTYYNRPLYRNGRVVLPATVATWSDIASSLSWRSKKSVDVDTGYSSGGDSSSRLGSERQTPAGYSTGHDTEHDEDNDGGDGRAVYAPGYGFRRVAYAPWTSTMASETTLRQSTAPPSSTSKKCGKTSGGMSHRRQAQGHEGRSRDGTHRGKVEAEAQRGRRRAGRSV